MSRVVIGLLTACAVFAVQAKELTYYLDFERVNVTYLNPRYCRSANITARRLARHDPIHYLQARIETLVAFGNNVTVDMSVYEFLSNEYRPSFLEFHYKLCDFLDKNKMLWSYVHKVLPYTSCPWPKGVYHFTNVSFQDIPLLKTFPFTKGRLFWNWNMWQTGERVGGFHVDVAIKQRWQ